MSPFDPESQAPDLGQDELGAARNSRFQILFIIKAKRLCALEHSEMPPNRSYILIVNLIEHKNHSRVRFEGTGTAKLSSRSRI